MLRHNFCRLDDRLVKLFLFSTLLDKSPLTSIYFATFENKREVRSPLPTQSKFLVFGNILTYNISLTEMVGRTVLIFKTRAYRSCSVFTSCTQYNVHRTRILLLLCLRIDADAKYVFKNCSCKQ